ncbi:stomatin-like protein 1 isoform X2 [Dendrobates tinctorius]|uniref:stomatin-like protein 1 isoform X2 n=1 Tax=Dendrobates tinctorius TaxID=92724 RepID=UPI003CC9BBC7
MWEQYKYTALPPTLEESAASQPARSDPSNSWLMRCCHIWITCLSFVILLITFPISIWWFLKIVPDYERVVIFRLGRVRPPKGPGLVLLLPLIDQFQRIDMRTRAFSIQQSKEDINEQVKQFGVLVECVDLRVETVPRPQEEHVNVPLSPQVVNSNGGLEQLITQFVSMVKEVSATDEQPSTDLSLQEMMSRLEGILSESLVSDIGSSYQLYVIKKDGLRTACFLDLTTGSGLSGMGVLSCPPDVTLEVTQEDLLSLIKGDLSPMTAYTTGRLRVTGNLQNALQLGKVLPKIMGS